MKKFLALSLSDVVFIMLINVKMPTIVGILTFMSRINFVLSLVEHEESFITSGPGHLIGFGMNQLIFKVGFSAKVGCLFMKVYFHIFSILDL